MAERDREKWNSKYRDMADLLAPRPPSAMVERFHKEAPGKRALDLACGAGRHTLFLARKGFHVDAVDISEVALDALREQTVGLDVDVMQADLDRFTPAPESYDLIVKTNYLDRDLIERAKAALKPGAVFIVETYVADEANEKRDANPDFLLRKGELPEIFHEGFETLALETFWNEPHEKYRMKKAAIAVKKVV